VLAIADNRGNIVAPFEVRPVNIHDIRLFEKSFENLLETADDLNLDITGTYLTLDSGFDSARNKVLIREAEMIPAIKPNIGARKDRRKIYAILDAFEPLKPIYKERVNIERCFAWEDSYRKMVVRYEKLQCTFMGFRYLAYSMINFRNIFN
jgi:hypothetical protein